MASSLVVPGALQSHPQHGRSPADNPSEVSSSHKRSPHNRLSRPAGVNHSRGARSIRKGDWEGNPLFRWSSHGNSPLPTLGDDVKRACDALPSSPDESAHAAYHNSGNKLAHHLSYDDTHSRMASYIRGHASNPPDDQVFHSSGHPRPVQQDELTSEGSSVNLPNVHLLQTLCNRGCLDTAVDALCNTQMPLPSSMYMSLLQACGRKKALAQVKRIHAHLTHYSPQSFFDLGAYLVVTLAKCGAIEEACMVSNDLPRRNVFSWTAIISAYVECGKPQQALDAYQSMKEDGIEPNVHTFPSIFKACACMGNRQLGQMLHLEAQEMGLSTDVFVGSTLVSMYSKLGLIAKAEDAFETMPQRDTVVWNAMLSVYGEDGQEGKVIRLYRQIREEHVRADNYTVVILIQACSKLAESKVSTGGQVPAEVSLNVGWAIVADALRQGCTLDDYVQTAFLTLLGKCGAIGAAGHLFSTMFSRSTVLWTAMLSAYAEQGHAEMVLLMFRQLYAEGFIADSQAFVVALKACALLAEREGVEVEPTNRMAFKIGQALHADACMKGYISDILVGTALINLYGKCRAIGDAEMVFSALPAHDAVSWTALLSILIEHDEESKASLVYRELRQSSSLDEVTLACILQACSKTGSLEMCAYVHFDIVSSGCDQICSLGATLLHTYASCGSVEDAQAVFERLADPELLSWNACIASHTAEASIDIYEKMRLANIEPNETTFTSVMSACSHGGLLLEGMEYFNSMSKDYGISPGLMHYGCLVSLFGRAGDFESVAALLKRMPVQADLTMWLGLLQASHRHGNAELALQAFGSALTSQSDHGASYVLMSNMYAGQPCSQMRELLSHGHMNRGTE